MSLKYSHYIRELYVMMTMKMMRMRMKNYDSDDDNKNDHDDLVWPLPNTQQLKPQASTLM